MRKLVIAMMLSATTACCHSPAMGPGAEEPHQGAVVRAFYGNPWEQHPRWGFGSGGPGGEPRAEHLEGRHRGEMMGKEMETYLYPPPLVMNFGREAGVTEDQMTKIRQDFFDTQSRVADLEPKLEKAHIEVQRLLASGQFDQAKILAQVDEASKAQAEIKQQRFAMLLRIRGLLSADQRQKLDAFESLDMALMNGQTKGMDHLQGGRRMRDRNSDTATVVMWRRLLRFCPDVIVARQPSTNVLGWRVVRSL